MLIVIEDWKYVLEGEVKASGDELGRSERDAWTTSPANEKPMVAALGFVLVGQGMD